MTALGVLDPERARDWLDRAEVVAAAGTAGTEQREWFLAMRTEFERPHYAALFLPKKPALCIGRDKQVNDLVETLLSPHPEPTPIVGGPGMGKSTVSLYALYDPKVAERYKDRRYFVRCKVASSRQTLVQAIAKEIGVPLSGSDLEPRVLAELERAPAVLVLDGAETPWLDDKDDVEDFLAILSQIPRPRPRRLVSRAHHTRPGPLGKDDLRR